MYFSAGDGSPEYLESFHRMLLSISSQPLYVLVERQALTLSTLLPAFALSVHPKQAN